MMKAGQARALLRKVMAEGMNASQAFDALCARRAAARGYREGSGSIRERDDYGYRRALFAALEEIRERDDH